MKQFTRRVRQVRRAFFDVRVLVALVGLILSVVLHELVHIFVHAGSITHISFFRDGAIVQITALAESGYTTHAEEALGYAVTFGVLIGTIALIAHLTDRKDTRTASEALISKSSPLRTLTKKEFFELASKIHLL